MNNVTLIGNLCRDFDLRTTQAGTSIASNTIAVKRDRKEADGTYASDFFDVFCFGAQADFAVKWLRKGDKICVAGSVHIRDYTTRNGTKGRAVEVAVNSIESLTSKEETGLAANANDVAPVQEQAAPTQTDESLQKVIDDLPDDDLPF